MECLPDNIAFYESAIREHEEMIRICRKRSGRISLLRLLVIIAGFIAALKCFHDSTFWGVCVTILTLAIFILLAVYHTRIEKQILRYQQSVIINRNEIDCTLFHTNLYDNGARYMDEAHPYSADLDIFGPGSLFHFINRSRTLQGNDILAGWLKQPAGTTAIAARSEAVRELAGQPHWRQQFALSLFPLQEDHQQDVAGKVLEGMQQPFNLPYAKLIAGYSRCAGPLVIISLAAGFYHAFFWNISVFLLIIHWCITGLYGRRIAAYQALFSGISGSLALFSEAIRQIVARRWTTELTRQLAGSLSGNQGYDAGREIRSLAKILHALDARLNIAVSVILEGCFLWSIQYTLALARWRQKNSAELQNMFRTVGTMEALSALAALTHNHPSWPFPVFSREYFMLEAVQIGHPLMPTGKCVTNDFFIAGKGKVDIITGSNMAGKSTFLRTIGINIVLACSGAPVCASSLRLSDVLPLTYMRIRDSLQDNTSTFRAELNRIAMILDHIRRGETCYVIIDEMFHGTNSHDKYIGSRALILELIASGSAAIIATHDTALAGMADEFPGAIRNFHFDSQVHGDDISFDYTLRPGKCSSFNASFLLKKTGLNVELPGEKSKLF